MTWKLFIDDERNPHDVTWIDMKPYFRCEAEEVICRTLDEVVLEIAKRKSFPIFISFDHDLGKNQATGHRIAKHLIEEDFEADPDGGIGFDENFDFVVHSMNPVGAANIRAALTGYLKEYVWR